MKRVLIVLFLFLPCVAQLNLQLENQQQEKMKLLLVILGQSAYLSKYVSLIASDLSCNIQKLTGFDVTVVTYEHALTKKDFQKFNQAGYPLVIIFDFQETDYILGWRMYDSQQMSMLLGKRTKLNNIDHMQKIHSVADQLWLALTGQPGIFSTRIAYCIETQQAKYKGSNICIQNPNGLDKKTVIYGGRLLAPRWNHDALHPLLLYSEVTPNNVRLLMADLQGHKKLVSNLEGSTLLPSFSSDGSSVVYCASYQGKSNIFYSTYDKKSGQKVMRRLTHNNGNNTSPILLPTGDILFCSDYELGIPQLYRYHQPTHIIERLTEKGFCTCPHYIQCHDSMVYCKLINGFTQLFVYTFKDKKHRQVTFDKTNKDECCWSPCGNYICYAQNDGKTSRIAILNMFTNEQFFLTDPDQRCFYPSWSCYQEI